MLDLSRKCSNSQDRVDFGRIAKAALLQAATIVPRWLPDGRRQGNEWVVRNPTRADRCPGSFMVNLKKGCWADFATGDKGGDLISLYAYLHGISQSQAARCLSKEDYR